MARSAASPGCVLLPVAPSSDEVAGGLAAGSRGVIASALARSSASPGGVLLPVVSSSDDVAGGLEVGSWEVVAVAVGAAAVSLTGRFGDGRLVPDEAAPPQAMTIAKAIAPDPNRMKRQRCRRMLLSPLAVSVGPL